MFEKYYKLTSYSENYLKPKITCSLYTPSDETSVLHDNFQRPQEREVAKFHAP
jgi:hypothetical protein